MKAQFKYAFLQGMKLRLIAFAAMVIFNVIFIASIYLDIFSTGIIAWGNFLSIISVMAIFVININVDIRILKSIFNPPNGYIHALVPVKRWKFLFARVVAIVIQDVIAIIVAISGIVFRILVSEEFNNINSFINAIKSQYGEYIIYEWIKIAIAFGFLAISLYMFILMLIVFDMALKNSVLFRMDGNRWGSLLIIIPTICGLSFFNFALTPLGKIYNSGIFYFIKLSLNSYNMMFYIISMIVQIVVLFVASSMLLEKKVNMQ